jgi:2,3-bisphosphoglycerate-independent phosphoglycerate mutase
VIFFNFRADRARELSRALVDNSFNEFDTSRLQDILLITLTEYDSSLPAIVAFPAPNVENPIAKLVSEANLKQLHIAETEKYAHVTYFLNGGREQPFEGEERILIPSPPVTSYESKPEMSALEIREKVVQAVNSDNFDFIAINFANADMVGHTGNMEATVQAIEVLDLCLGSISKAVLAKDGILIITADHGNAESMIDPNTGEIDKEHTSLPVPFIIIGHEYQRSEALPDPPDMSQMLSGGLLSDVAPTLMNILQLPTPEGMSGRSLV